MARGKQLAIGAGALVVLVVAVLVVAQRLGSEERRDVLVVGDSVSYLSGGAISGELGRSTTDFAARVGYTSEAIYPVAVELIQRPGTPAAARDVVVVLIGYNDVGTDAVDPEALDALLELAEEFRCGVFFTLPARPGGEPATNPNVTTEKMEAWNELLGERIEAHPDLHLATDWQDAVEEAEVGELLDEDGLHPNEAGQRALADAYRAAIDRYCEAGVLGS